MLKYSTDQEWEINNRTKNILWVLFDLDRWNDVIRVMERSHILAHRLELPGSLTGLADELVDTSMALAQSHDELARFFRYGTISQGIRAMGHALTEGSGLLLIAKWKGLEKALELIVQIHDPLLRIQSRAMLATDYGQETTRLTQDIFDELEAFADIDTAKIEEVLSQVASCLGPVFNKHMGSIKARLAVHWPAVWEALAEGYYQHYALGDPEFWGILKQLWMLEGPRRRVFDRLPEWLANRGTQACWAEVKALWGDNPTLTYWRCMVALLSKDAVSQIQTLTWPDDFKPSEVPWDGRLLDLASPFILELETQEQTRFAATLGPWRSAFWILAQEANKPVSIQHKDLVAGLRALPDLATRIEWQLRYLRVKSGHEAVLSWGSEFFKELKTNLEACRFAIDERLLAWYLGLIPDGASYERALRLILCLPSMTATRLLALVDHLDQVDRLLMMQEQAEKIAGRVAANDQAGFELCRDLRIALAARLCSLDANPDWHKLSRIPHDKAKDLGLLKLVHLLLDKRGDLATAKQLAVSITTPSCFFAARMALLEKQPQKDMMAIHRESLNTLALQDECRLLVMVREPVFESIPKLLFETMYFHNSMIWTRCILDIAIPLFEQESQPWHEDLRAALLSFDLMTLLAGFEQDGYVLGQVGYLRALLSPQSAAREFVDMFRLIATLKEDCEERDVSAALKALAAYVQRFFLNRAKRPKGIIVKGLKQLARQRPHLKESIESCLAAIEGNAGCEQSKARDRVVNLKAFLKALRLSEDPFHPRHWETLRSLRTLMARPGSDKLRKRATSHCRQLLLRYRGDARDYIPLRLWLHLVVQGDQEPSLTLDEALERCELGGHLPDQELKPLVNPTRAASAEDLRADLKGWSNSRLDCLSQMWPNTKTLGQIGQGSLCILILFLVRVDESITQRSLQWLTFDFIERTKYLWLALLLPTAALSNWVTIGLLDLRRPTGYRIKRRWGPLIDILACFPINFFFLIYIQTAYFYRGAFQQLGPRIFEQCDEPKPLRRRDYGLAHWPGISASTAMLLLSLVFLGNLCNAMDWLETNHALAVAMVLTVPLHLYVATVAAIAIAGNWSRLTHPILRIGMVTGNVLLLVPYPPVFMVGFVLAALFTYDMPSTAMMIQGRRGLAVQSERWRRLGIAIGDHHHWWHKDRLNKLSAQTQWSGPRFGLHHLFQCKFVELFCTSALVSTYLLEERKIDLWSTWMGLSIAALGVGLMRTVVAFRIPVSPPNWRFESISWCDLLCQTQLTCLAAGLIGLFAATREIQPLVVYTFFLSASAFYVLWFQKGRITLAKRLVFNGILAFFLTAWACFGQVIWARGTWEPIQDFTLFSLLGLAVVWYIGSRLLPLLWGPFPLKELLSSRYTRRFRAALVCLIGLTALPLGALFLPIWVARRSSESQKYVLEWYRCLWQAKCRAS